jgi:hypothetical protein
VAIRTRQQARRNSPASPAEVRFLRASLSTAPHAGGGENATVPAHENPNS